MSRKAHKLDVCISVLNKYALTLLVSSGLAMTFLDCDTLWLDFTINVFRYQSGSCCSFSGRN